MKKLILAVTALFAAASMATAQTAVKVEAGANFSNQTTKVGDTSKDGQMLIGYRAGAGVEIGITDGFYVNPGLYFLSRGAQASVEVLGVKTTAKTWLHNVQVPVHFGYRADLGGNMGVSIQAGPWFSYGYLGKVPTTVQSNTGVDVIDNNISGTKVSSYNPYSSTPKTLKPFDLGVGMQAAFEYAQFGLNVGFEYGLLNTSAINNRKVNNMNFYVGLGYRFGL